MKEKLYLGFVAVALLFAYSMVSCSKEKEYMPTQASVMFNSVYISIEDSSGNDLLANPSFSPKIQIKGEQSKRNIPFTIEEKNGKTMIYFAADLPDLKDMNPPLSDGVTESYGNSSMLFNFNGNTKKLVAKYRYSLQSQMKEMYGGNGIYIQQITIGDDTVSEQENTIFLKFVYIDEKLDLLK